MTDLETQVQELAEKVTRKLLAEIHFGSEKSGPCSPGNKANSAWLDNRAKYLSPFMADAIRESWKLGRKQALEEVASIVSHDVINWSATGERRECVGGCPACEIRRLIESED